jgi:hypothetical protein
MPGRIRWAIKILVDVSNKTFRSNLLSLTRVIEKIARHLFRGRSEAQTFRDRSEVTLVESHLSLLKNGTKA